MKHVSESKFSASDRNTLEGQEIVKEMLKQHLVANNGKYPETVAVTLWGLDTIKTRGMNVSFSLCDCHIISH